MTNRRLIVVCGPPCSGKSTIARALSARTGAIHLELDSILVRLLPGSAHSEKDRDVAYRAMHTIAECLLRSVDEVIPATYALPAESTAIPVALSSPLPPKYVE